MGQTQKIMYDTYEIDIDKRIVKDDSKELSLTTLEFDLLLMLVKNKNKSFSRSHILETVWGDNYFGSDRVVDDLVRRLRKKKYQNVENIFKNWGIDINTFRPSNKSG